MITIITDAHTVTGRTYAEARAALRVLTPHGVYGEVWRSGSLVRRGIV